MGSSAVHTWRKNYLLPDKLTMHGNLTKVKRTGIKIQKDICPRSLLWGQVIFGNQGHLVKK